MVDHIFHQGSPITRKPLPGAPKVKHIVYDGKGKLQDDDIPLISIDDRISWSPAPLTDFSRPETQTEVPQTAQRQRHGKRQHWSGSGGYSKFSPHSEGGQHSVWRKKSPFGSQGLVFPDGDPQNLRRMWNSKWLSTWVLSGLVVLFLALVAAVIVLRWFAHFKNGINTDITNNHYAWTYGPTGLLVLIGVAWSQVDFHCRILAPWLHLQHGPASAKQSLILDYISPIMPKTLLLAAQNRDWAVLASGIGTVLLRIVIVFSTGLLVLTPTSVSETTSKAVLNSTFTGTNYTIGPSVIDTELMRYYGIQQRGLEYPYGTSASVAYNTLDLKSLRANSTVTAQVDGVFPFFDCEIVSPKIIGDNFTWTNDGTYPYADELNLALTLLPDKCPPLESFYQLCQAPNCPLGRSILSEEQWNSPDSYNPDKPLDDLDPCANLYQLTVVDITFEKVSGHPSNTSAAWNVTLSDSVGIVCALGYTINKVGISVNTAGPTSSGGVNTTGPLQLVADVLPGFSYHNLTQDFQNEIYVNNLPTPVDAPSIADFAKLFAILNGGSAIALLNGTTLKSTAEKAFKGVAVQLAHSYLRKTDNVTTTANSVYQEPRLQVRELSVWAMSAGFGLLAFSAAAVIIWRTKDVVSRRPNSIGIHASILAASAALQKELETSTSYPSAQFGTHLQGLLTVSRVKNEHGNLEFAIETVANETDRAEAMGNSSKISWWKPISATFWFMCAALLSPLAIIVVLEVLQHRSDTRDGLAAISPTSTIDHSLPAIFTSAIMTSIAMMYGAIDFATATLAPYQLLARGSAPAKQTLLSTQLGNLPIWSTVKAIRERHMEAAVASVAALIGGVLTIVASGLYTIDAVPVALDVTVVTSDKIVPSFSTVTDGSAGAMFQLIELNNASYPARTYDELTFPNLELRSLGAEVFEQLSDPTQSLTFQTSIVATRASLNCTLVPRDLMSMATYVYPEPGADYACPDNVITFNATLPSSCPHFLNGEDQIASVIPFSYNVQHTCADKASLGLFEQLVLNSAGAMGDATFLTPDGSTLGAASNPPECPSLAFMSGYFVVNGTSTENVTAVTCIQGLEEVEAQTIFTISGDTIQILSKPKVNESSARWLQAFNSTYWFTKSGTFGPLTQDDDTLTGSDVFYSQVHHGPDGILAEELTGPSNTQRFIDATQHVYRRYMAQLINFTMRQNLNSTEAESAPRYPGTVSGFSRLRLKQDATSKLILQVLLGAMFACGIFVYSRRNMHRVLPHCPWSIAGTMSLLAGSEVIERKIIPVGAEFMDEKELAKLFEGYVFSLGWWDTSPEGANSLVQRRRFGIDIGKADTSPKAYFTNGN